MYFPLTLKTPLPPINKPIPKFAGPQLIRLNAALGKNKGSLTDKQITVLNTSYTTVGVRAFSGKDIIELITEVIEEENKPAFSSFFKTVQTHYFKKWLESLRLTFGLRSDHSMMGVKSIRINWNNKDLSTGIILEQLFSHFPKKQNHVDLLKALKDLNESGLLKVSYASIIHEEGSDLLIEEEGKELLRISAPKGREKEPFSYEWPDFISLPSKPSS